MLELKMKTCRETGAVSSTVFQISLLKDSKYHWLQSEMHQQSFNVYQTQLGCGE